MQGEPVSITSDSPPASGAEGGIATRHLLLTPQDPDLPARVRRLRELGISNRAIPEYDDFARQMAQGARGRIALVNFNHGNRQFLAGLHATEPETLAVEVATVVSQVAVSRELPSGLGYCANVLVRRKALVLDDIRDFPRFAGDPLVDMLDLRSYMGAPLIDHTGTALGTVAVLDQDPHPWGRKGLEFIKSMAARMVEGIDRSEHDAGNDSH
jgi:GAF domain-containing protein